MIQKKSVSGKTYSDMTRTAKHSRKKARIEELENVFWSSLAESSPLYGSDVRGSLFVDEDEAGAWDLRRLDSCLRDGMGSTVLDGINSPYLYFGSFRTMFAWHVEDYNMASINFQHFGAPKIWYGISRKVGLLTSGLQNLRELPQAQVPFQNH
ncbi:MAG: hypothetical protein AAF449_08025 [Myxococcota bacterium]